MDRGIMVHAIALAVVLQLSNVAGVPSSTLAPAQSEVARSYRGIGVDVEWSRAGSHRSDQPAILVVLIGQETGALQQQSETVMGAAVRTAGGTGAAYVFVRRVESEAAQFGVPVEFVLACAIAPAPRTAVTSDIPGSAETAESCPPPPRATAASCR